MNRQKLLTHALVRLGEEAFVGFLVDYGFVDGPFLSALAERLEIQAELDDVVHDVASELGSGVNNGGRDIQIAFLADHAGVEATAELLLAALTAT